MKATASLSNIELAGLLMDVMPPTMRLIRRSLWESARGELTVPQLRILSHVNRGVSTAAELAAEQGVSLPAISKMVQGLVARGLLAKNFKNGNRKQIFLALTPKGKRSFLKVRRAGQLKISHKLEHGGREDRRTIQAGLAMLEKLLKKQKVSEK